MMVNLIVLQLFCFVGLDRDTIFIFIFIMLKKHDKYIELKSYKFKFLRKSIILI